MLEEPISDAMVLSDRMAVSIKKILNLHAPMTIEVMQSGKRVLAEKPMPILVAEALK